MRRQAARLPTDRKRPPEKGEQQMVDNGLPEKGKEPCIFGVAGSSVKGILILLLALGVCFSYFYFFTDVLRPKEETPTQADVSGTEVKKPLPARALQNTSTSAAQTVRVAPASPAPLVETPAKPAVSSEKQERVPSKTPEASPSVSAKPVPAVSKPTPSAQKPSAAPKEAAPLTAKQKETTKKAAASDTQKTVAGKAPPSAVAVKPTEKTVTVKPGPRVSLPQKKSAGAEQKQDSTSTAKQKAAPAKKGDVSEAKVAEEAGKTLSKKEGKGFSLVIGTYVLKSTLKADTAKLEKAGVHPSVVAGPKKNQPMNRLVVGEFDSYTSAHTELDRLKKTSKDAFLLQENGKYTLYAGSYYRQERALEQQERLRTQGFAPILKKAVAPVVSWKVMVGGFPTREAAQEEAAKLRKLGFKPYPTQSGAK
jgi:cell division protein FtsN